MFLFVLSLLYIWASPVSDSPTTKQKAPRPFFTDTVIDLDQRTPDEILQELLAYDARYGLHILTIGQNRYWVEPLAELEIETGVSECSDVEYGVIHCHGHYLFGGLESVRDGYFEEMIRPDAEIFPEPYRFEFGGRSYELFATADVVDGQYEYARNMRIGLRDLSSGTEQTLALIPELDNALPRVLFIGDLEGDGKPDLLLQQGYHYEYHEVHLYASSLAREGELVGRVGSSGMWRDC